MVGIFGSYHCTDERKDYPEGELGIRVERAVTVRHSKCSLAGVHCRSHLQKFSDIINSAANSVFT